MTFTNTSEYASSYIWEFGDGNIIYVCVFVCTKEKGCKPDLLQPFDIHCGAYRNRTDDLVPSQTEIII